MKYKCIIIDDEPLAREIIEGYIANIPEFSVPGTFGSAVEAFSFLNRENADLLFLDIQMPGLTGLELLKSIKNPPEVVFITAHREYAPEGFELEALDYLLKPVSFERFLKAAGKFLNKKKSRNEVGNKEGKFEPGHIFIRAERKNIKIKYDEILFIESVKDYSKIVTAGNKIFSKVSIGVLENDLPPRVFIRVHRSFIINLEKVTAYTQNFVEIGKNEIPLGNLYRDDFLNRISIH